VSINENYETAAKRLRAAYAGGPIPPLRDLLAPVDLEGAYAVQTINTDYWCSAGRETVGRKVGLTATAVQEQLGVSQPDFGVLFGDMQVDDGAKVSRESLIQPRVEAEVAIILGTDLPGPLVTRLDLENAITEVAAAIEIVDSRIADWNISFSDTVADNGSSGLFVLSARKRELAGLDLWSCGMVLTVNGKVRSLGAGAACMGHPLNAAIWLSNTLVERGDPLRAGDIVLTGALGPMTGIAPGDSVEATIGGLGTVGFEYAK